MNVVCGSPALPEVLPLLLFLGVPRLGLLLLRSGGGVALATNLAIFCGAELAFYQLALCVVRLALHCRGVVLLALRYLLLPLMQVLGIADGIYSILVGAPLRLRLVTYFLANLQSDYLQHILAAYVGVGIPLLAASLFGSLGILNRLFVRTFGRVTHRHRRHKASSPGIGPGTQQANADLSATGAALCTSVLLLGLLGLYGRSLAPSGAPALRLLATGNVVVRFSVEAVGAAAASPRLQEPVLAEV
eukprot:SAG11_NODE_10360_length_837_cov_1.047425_1_plen_245_part_10